MWTRFVCRLASVVLVAALGAVPARAELIVNGGFELPVVPPGTEFVTLSGGDIPGWTISAGTVDVYRDTWPAFQGHQSLDLSGSPGPPGTAIFQSFATVPGESYLLSFRYANNTGVSFATGRVEILGMGGNDLINDLLTHAGSTPADMNYLLYSQTFTANSATTTLRFTHLGSSVPDFGGLALDDVRAASTGVVPEPSSLTLASLGTLGLIGYARRRRRKMA